MMNQSLTEGQKQFLRFCVVGGICTLLDATIYYVVLCFASRTIAMTMGYCVSLLLNYYLTVYWTFRTKSTAKNAIGIVLAHLFNLFIVRMGLMYIWCTLFFCDERIAYIPTLAISVVINFLIIKLIIRS